MAKKAKYPIVFFNAEFGPSRNPNEPKEEGRGFYTKEHSFTFRSLVEAKDAFAQLINNNRFQTTNSVFEFILPGGWEIVSRDIWISETDDDSELIGVEHKSSI